MKIIIDTNVLLISIPSRSPYHNIIQAFNKRKYDLILSNPILLEYEEILSSKANSIVAKNVLGAFLEAPNVIIASVYYNWNLISQDPDDNKFTDAYVNGGADYLVTNDAHFNIVKSIGFPKINVISASDFLKLINTFLQ